MRRPGGVEILGHSDGVGRPAARDNRSREVEARLMYKAGDMPSESDFDPSLLPKGYSFTNGRVTKIMKSKRPPDIYPEIWNSWNAKQKEEARRDY